MKKRLPLVFAATFITALSAAQTWQPFVNQPTFRPGTPLLLTDGTVMVHEAYSPNWWKLTPSSTGNYVAGKWTQLASTDWAPEYYASAVLADGRVFAMGGEYNYFTETESNNGAIYDPVANTWTDIPPPPISTGSSSTWNSVGDAQCCVLADGRVMMANIYSSQTAILDPATLTWTLSGNGKADQNSEEGWSLLKDGSVLTVDVWNPNNAERYIPGIDTWVSAGSTPLPLANTNADEIGPQVLLPTGQVFCVGATTHTALFTPPVKSGQIGSWTEGPEIPGGLDVADGPAVVLPNGHVLFVASPGVYQTPSTFFDFDGTNITATSLPSDASYSSSYYYTLLMLPTGQVLMTSQNDAEIFTPAGSAPSTNHPGIKTYPNSVSASTSNYQITGTQLNGMTQCSAYGDDAQNATNYPLVRISNLHTGSVTYCRTHDHSTMGVATGSAVVSTYFDVPFQIDSGPSVLQVVTNGIASAKYAVNVVSFNIKSLSPPDVLLNSTGNVVKVNGSGFVSGSQVLFDGVAQPTTFINQNQVSFPIQNDVCTVAAHHTVAVENPDTTTTSSLQFTVINPVPSATSYSPNPVPADSAAHLVAIHGTNFQPSSLLYFNSVKVSCTYVSPTEIDFTIPASMTTTNVTDSVQVRNVSPGGGYSQYLSIIIGTGSGGGNT